MDRRKLPNLVLALVVIASLLVGASGGTSAAMPAPDVTVSAFVREVTPAGVSSAAATAPPDPKDKWVQKYKQAQEKKAKRITPAGRQADADRAAAKGFVLPKLRTAATERARSEGLRTSDDRRRCCAEVAAAAAAAAALPARRHATSATRTTPTARYPIGHDYPGVTPTPRRQCAD